MFLTYLFLSRFCIKDQIQFTSLLFIELILITKQGTIKEIIHLFLFHKMYKEKIFKKKCESADREK